MSTVIQKICPRPGSPACGAIYNEEFQSEYCDACGATLLIKEVKIEEKLNIFETSIPSEDTNKPIDETIQNLNENSNKDDATIQEQPKDEDNTDIFTVDSLGYIHFIEAKEDEELNEDKIVIYLSGKVYKEIPLEYDETIIGRHSVNSDPDVDLSPIDPEGYTSRRHLMIYKENDKFFARNLSTKNSVHVERDALANGESKELNDNDLILLSRYVVMVFRRKQ